MPIKPHYHRILLKLSGESLGNSGTGIDLNKLKEVVDVIRALRALRVELAIVIGGGNIWRKRNQGGGMDEVTADFMGMVATVINALALQQRMFKSKIKVVVQSPICFDLPGVDKLNPSQAQKFLKSGVVIFAGGTGKPFFTTDTSAVNRAQDIKANLIIKAGPADGVYTADPKTNKSAKKYLYLSFNEAIKKKLGVMDMSALKFCQKHGLKVLVCKWNKVNVLNAATGKKVGTLVS